MDRSTQDAKEQRPPLRQAAVMVRNNRIVLSEWGDDQTALPQVVQEIQETSQQPQSTFWRLHPCGHYVASCGRPASNRRARSGDGFCLSGSASTSTKA